MENKLDKLTRTNKLLAAFHGFQAVLILLLSTSFALPVITSYLVFNEQSQSLQQASKTLFDMPFAPLVAIFFLLSAGFHLYIATLGNKKYRSDLKKGMNKLRWIEYSLSASIMMICISMLAGVYELSLLLAVFAFTAIMNLCGLIMETHNQGEKKLNWSSYWLGCLAGIIPWIVVGIYFWGAATGSSGAAAIPTFVYFIYISIFVFFNAFAVNMVLQYKKVGKWQDYLYGERTYMLLSLVAKSLLAWQVFAGTLQP